MPKDPLRSPCSGPPWLSFTLLMALWIYRNSHIEYFQWLCSPRKSMKYVENSFFKDPGICILHSRKTFFKYTYIKRSVVLERGSITQSVNTYGTFSPKKECRWIKMEQEVSPYLDFKASFPLTPSAGKCRADNAFSSEIFSEETLSQTIAPGTRGFRTIRRSTTWSGSLPSPGKCHVPEAGSRWALLASLLRWPCMSYPAPSSLPSPAGLLLCVVSNHCVTCARHSPQCVPRKTIPQAVLWWEGLRRSREPGGSLMYSEAAVAWWLRTHRWS